jgi:FkbM family methyltransferase
MDLTKTATNETKMTLIESKFHYNCDVVQASAHHSPFRENCIDVVYSFGVLHHIPKMDDVLNEIKRILNKNGKVYAFEPVPYLFNILRFHCSLFNLKNVITENKAVADHEGCLKLILSEGNVQDNRLAYTENVNKYVLINTTSLDKYFEKQSVLPDIVKIDAQGADYKVLKGMINLIKKKNLVIFCEFWPEGIRRCGDDPLEFLMFISNLGFKIFEINKKIIVLTISII